ncbi:TetR/AcrR family transcriptional regulator [Salinibacterium sp. G-O1]|uniref:TetR/AcrR family transcriptional regulator n=1 Tax=Salinibacterium sp. G-O1 TaxID=3046208 RepID=UPI0024B8A690|nr:TetR/AcrR family transcriptional regulator [Salinibacterium sp. G-O1]MDJ0336575.1 TetR/AcrR family transcriptional regulator [Salinibacterium sp. G-O1]
MASNPERRAVVTDAALVILGRDGGRALTHRAVDALADIPSGTCANYFPTRATLLLAMAKRIFDRLEPAGNRLTELEQVTEEEALASYAGYVVERLTKNPDMARALIELRLEASRDHEVHDALAPFLRQGLSDDLEFHQVRGLGANPRVVILLHHLVNGILLDHLTIPLDPHSDPVATAKEAAQHLASGVQIIPGTRGSY